ncbi:putative transcription factor, MBF1 like protein [Polaromonas sp. CF318]|uniref:helix-turn-helix domain-containing protein n=1 Tax=Polaromonas sp. CF318 TaxID=1144318 RepID=UPI0002710FC1|nr:helix-turn-helix transcriptional regulator [Polaromonas sp. CF318]EJL88205.1 putative transcription factor, MBF1 like protein [Polaromonas sp. CF318]
MKPIPFSVDRTLQRLGQNIALARLRRNLSQAALAERIGTSVNTVRRMEAGHPGTALQHLARTLQVLGGLGALDQLLDTQQDAVGLALMDEKLPRRARLPKARADSGAF